MWGEGTWEGMSGGGTGEVFIGPILLAQSDMQTMETDAGAAASAEITIAAPTSEAVSMACEANAWSDILTTEA